MKNVHTLKKVEIANLPAHNKLCELTYLKYKVMNLFGVFAMGNVCSRSLKANRYIYFFMFQHSINVFVSITNGSINRQVKCHDCHSEGLAISLLECHTCLQYQPEMLAEKHLQKAL